MVRKCCVEKCLETDLTILSHRFPKSKIAEEWQQALNLTQYDPDNLKKSYVVCTKHFTSKAYRNNVSNFLNSTALPNLKVNQCNTRINKNGSELEVVVYTKCWNNDGHESQNLINTPRVVKIITDKEKDKIKEIIQQEHSQELNEEDTSLVEIHEEITVDDQILDKLTECVYVHRDCQTDDQPVEKIPIIQNPIDPDDKFIATVYPEYQNKTKMELIELILENNRKIEALDSKFKDILIYYIQSRLRLKMDALRYKLTDYLENRVLVKNTGTCKSCKKSVYWSREKVNSHKRSKNCNKVTEDELIFFQKTLPSRAKNRKTDIKCKIENEKITKKESLSPKLEVIRKSVVEEHLNEEESVPKSVSAYEKEDKFIGVIYPTFKGTTKLELIEEILEVKRKNQILEDKVKTYAKAINDLL
ncbi:unnamed protein product [Diamesa hyperborea]